ncbi:hypothetical protein V2J09_004753 [Rumex salicifolius]
MDEEQRSLLIRSFSHYSSSPGLELRYGVHGFVGDESVLRSASYRIGILAALRSMKSKSVTGIMITACGHSVKKNGVRIVDPDSGALIADWEPLADSVANATDPDEFVTLVEELAKKENISFGDGQSAEVLLARDTSPSGEAFLEAAKQGVSSVAGAVFHDMGILTTPQLHWLVRARNIGRNASEHDYLQHLSYSYRCLVDLIPEGTTTDKVGESLIVDGANGVGGDKIEALKDLCDGLEIEIRNTSKGGAILEQGVGVDFIREQKIVPSGFGSSDIHFRCASLDGDGDRLLYFSVLPSQEIEVVDGDKILFLFTLYINEQLTILQEVESENEVHYDARLGILQNVYEIRESTNYLKSLGLDVVSFTSGTRSLHAVASNYDIGIYFEGDGRVGILFSENYLLWLEEKNNELLSSSKGSRKQRTVSRLLAVSRLMNSTVPDALASLLMVEAILQHNGWSLQKWNEKYCDLVNRHCIEVELAEKIAAPTDITKTEAVSYSGTKEEADTLIDEARSENADVSHLSQESKNIDEGPNESAEQSVNYEAHNGEQIDVDGSVELGQNQEQGITTYFQASENGTHTELAEGFQEKHESQTVHLHNDETSDEIKLEASAEEDSQDLCVIKRPAEEHEFDAELVVSLESHICPAKMPEEAEDPEHANDEEVTDIKREADDDSWVLVSDGRGDCLNSKLGGPLNEKESCSSLESNGIHAPVENVDALPLSADTAKLEGVSILESALDAQTQSQMSSSLHFPETTDYEHLPKLDEPSNEKETCSSPKAKGIHAPVENVDDLLVLAEAEEGGVISGLEFASDAQPQSQTSSGVHLPELDEPSDEKEICSSPKVNGMVTQSGNVNDLLVSSDTERAVAGDNTGPESACDAQPQSQTSSGDRVPSVIVHDEQLEIKAQNGSVDVDNGSISPVNGPNSRVCLHLDGNDINVPVESGEALPIFSDVGTTEETGDLNAVEYASCTKSPSEVNGTVTLTPYEHVAKVEAITVNSPINIDSNLFVNGKKSDTRINFSSSEVCSVEPSVETLKNLPIPSGVDDTEKEGSTYDGVDIKLLSHIPCTVSSVDHDRKLESEAENGGLNVENGDANIVVAEAEELFNPSDVVQVERSVADGAGTANHDNDVISGLPAVQVTEPEINSENDSAEVESKSESTIDNIEGFSSPCLNRTVETEVGNELLSIPYIQPPSQINGSSFELHEAAHHGGLETQVESRLLDALDTETITVADGTTPQIQVDSHDAQETYKAENFLVSGDKRSDCLVANSLNWEITIGSMQCVCPKSETPITASRDVYHDGSASSNLGKDDSDIEVVAAIKEFHSQQHVSDNHCDRKVEDTFVRESSDFPPEDSAMSAVAGTEGDINTRSAVNGTVHAVETYVDEESTSSIEGSANAVVDGQSVNDEIVKKPFYYLIRIPKYDDEKLSEQIGLAEMLLEEMTLNRDAALAEYRHKKDNCQKLRANQQAAILEERAARDLVRSKRKEIDSAQSLVNIAKDAMTIEDLDNKIAKMEHIIQHETVSLNEEKKLIREIKQSTKLREQLLATTKNQGVQQALDHKDKNEDHVKALRKELDALRIKLSEAEHAVAAAMKNLDSEHAILNELHKKLTLSNDVRQEAYSNLQSLRSQWSEKNKYFWTCKNAQRQANSYAASGDKTSLQSVCVNQVESVMKVWNLDNEFRKDYIRCNLRSTLRRLGTSDGRSLGPDEEAPLLLLAPARRIISSVKDRKESKTVASQPEPVTEARKADTKSANKVVEQKKPDVVSIKPKKSSSSKKEEEEAAQASNTVKIEEEKEDLKAIKEQEESARKTEELRKLEEAVKLKERRRLEEKAKFQEALERKRRKAEKAQAKAELRSKRQAEEKEKEKEKRARKKQNKSGRLSVDTNSTPESENVTNPDAFSEQSKETETREKSVTLIKRAQKPQYAKQNKLKTILPPPPPLRNRGRRRTQQWMWMAVTIFAILILFFLGNLNFPEIKGVFSSWH